MKYPDEMRDLIRFWLDYLVGMLHFGDSGEDEDIFRRFIDEIQFSCFAIYDADLAVRRNFGLYVGDVLENEVISDDEC